jgi:hypothetical protein
MPALLRLRYRNYLQVTKLTKHLKRAYLFTLSRMKKKISISIEQEVLSKIEELARQSTFRNRSHVIELALENFTKK